MKAIHAQVQTHGHSMGECIFRPLDLGVHTSMRVELDRIGILNADEVVIIAKDDYDRLVAQAPQK